ncbi:peptidoglycan-recognition protein SC2-like [Pelodiscus sinensis]|uniref:peptidoglycan-recognition protein SC2-like n=1 Tax=Pelodiscus sinensis TaxID=13735 RepID=UPI003F6AC3DB
MEKQPSDMGKYGAGNTSGSFALTAHKTCPARGGAWQGMGSSSLKRLLRRGAQSGSAALQQEEPRATLQGRRHLSILHSGPSERTMLLLTQVVWFAALCAVVLGCPTIVSRSQWGARPPKSRVPLKTPVPLLIIHHTDGKSCSSQAACSRVVKGIQNDHMDRNRWADIGYNFLVGEDGRVYEGRGWTTRGAHAPSMNKISLGVSFMGSYTGRTPSPAALNAARGLIQCAISRGYLRRDYTLKGHRNVNPTDCPGNALYRLITKWPHFKA